MKFDVVIYDRVGMPFSGTSLTTKGLGGSEQHAIFLAEMLAESGRTVLVASNTHKVEVTNGVVYAESAAVHAVAADTLIVWRYSPVPAIPRRKLVVMATDTYGPGYEQFASVMDGSRDATLVCVSQWQADGFPKTWNKRVIPPIIPEKVHALGIVTRPPSEGPRRYVYASAVTKGLRETLEAWHELALPDAELLVTNPGYDVQAMPKDLGANVRFLGVLPSYWDVIKVLHDAEALFYVNTFPETFGVTPALAEALGCRIHILCLNGKGALDESVLAPIMTDRAAFLENVRLAHEGSAPLTEHRCPQFPSLTPKSVLPQWEELLTERKPTGICLTMIVKNEAHIIERCLESVKPIIDRWVIVDTGSSDETRKVVVDAMKGVPGRLEDRQWVNFAANRNEAISIAREHFPECPFQLVIDADDVLEVNGDFRGLPDAETTECYTLEVADIHGGGTLSYERPHIFRGAKGWHYTGAIHEYLAAEGQWTRSTKKLDTLTYVRLGGGGRSRDPNRWKGDIAILKACIEKDPLDARSCFYLAQTYKDASQWDKAEEYYTKRANMLGWEEETYVAVLNAARMKEQLGRPREEVVSAYCRARDRRPSRAESMYYLSRYLRVAHGDFQGAADAAGMARSLPRPEDTLFIESDVYEWRANDEYAISLFYIGGIAKAKELNEHLLTKAPPSGSHRIRENLRFCTDALPK